MSQIHNLIKKHCPNGVEFKKLCEISLLKAGDRITKAMMSDKFKYPVIGGGTLPTGNYNDFNRSHCITISRAGSAGFVNWQENEFWATDVCFTAENLVDFMNLKFIYYFLKNLQKDLQSHLYGGSLPKLDKNYLWNFKIPIPPLEVQNEIVKILDNFTKLEAELEAELEARRRQYYYYRDKLLSFDTHTHTIKWVSLGEVARYSKDRISFEKLNEFNYVGVENLLQNRQGKVNSNYVPNDGNFTAFCENDILIGNIRPYLKKIWFANLNGGTNGDVLVLQNLDNNQIYSKFLFYVLASDKFFAYDIQNSKGAKMPRGDKQAILKFKFPLPSLEKQKEIVEILDKFDALVNDLSVGLPAEINARRKQYEFYRDKLLSFDEII